MSDPQDGEGDGERPAAPQPARLDPERAIRSVRRSREGGPPPRRDLPEEPIDTRRYQWMVGGIGLVLLIAFSMVLYLHGGGSSTPGVAPGQRLHDFVAPLATSDLDAAANTHPHCDPSRAARRGLNVCGRRAIVLAFFAAGAAPCVRQVDALQAVAPRFPRLEFAAVAIGAGHAQARRLVRSHHWTIPVAYDETGAVGQLYGISVCPMLELAGAGGRVEQRLVGEQWEQPAQLAAAVRRLAAAGAA